MTTTHANSPEQAISRLETLCLMAGLDLPLVAIRRQIADSVHLIVQQARLSDGARRVTNISEVVGLSRTGTVEVRPLYLFAAGPAAEGRAPEHQATGFMPTYLDELERHHAGEVEGIF